MGQGTIGGWDGGGFGDFLSVQYTGGKSVRNPVGRPTGSTGKLKAAARTGLGNTEALPNDL